MAIRHEEWLVTAYEKLAAERRVRQIRDRWWRHFLSTRKTTGRRRRRGYRSALAFRRW